jgi:hypothetical protein
MKKFIAFFAFMILIAGVASAQTQNATENNSEKKEHVVKDKASCGTEKASCNKAEGGKACCSKDAKKEEGKACCSKDAKKEEGKACCSKDGKKEEGKACCSKDAKKEEKAQPKP